MVSGHFLFTGVLRCSFLSLSQVMVSPLFPPAAEYGTGNIVMSAFLSFSPGELAAAAGYPEMIFIHPYHFFLVIKLLLTFIFTVSCVFFLKNIFLRKSY